MLPYSSPFNKPVIISPLVKIVSAQFAKLFWKVPFKSEEMSNMYNDELREWEDRLTEHCRETIVASDSFLERNHLTSQFKAIFDESIYSLHKAYSQMLLWKKNYDPKDEVYLIKENRLYAPNYFTVEGEFNDFAWTKHVVLDPNCTIAFRFQLACCYWLENETELLWSELKNSYNDSMLDIEARIPDQIVAIRILMLESYIPYFVQNPQNLGNYFELGLRAAAELGYEYATYYFWEKITDKEKITSSDSFFLLLSNDYDFPHDKVSYFLYSKLSDKRKEEFLDWTLQHDEQRRWLPLLLSPYTEEVRSEIIEHVCRLPSANELKYSYSFILNVISSRIMKHELPFYREVLWLLWFNLPEEEREQMMYQVSEDTYNCLSDTFEDILQPQLSGQKYTGLRSFF